MATDRGTMFGYQDMIGLQRHPSNATICNYRPRRNTPHYNNLIKPGVTGGRPDMIETAAKLELLLVLTNLY
jgi:hypothetical protein